MRVVTSPQVLNKILSKRDKALSVLGALMVTLMAKQVRINKSIVTSNLINSLTYSTAKEAVKPSGKTDGGTLALAAGETVKAGTTVIYAPRVEFGFIGKDSLGRYYTQLPKSFMRIGILAGKTQLNNTIKRILKAGT